MMVKSSQKSKKTDLTLQILAFEKSIVASDGYMYETNWDERKEACSAIGIIEKTVRGTKASENASDKDKRESNIQTIDAAGLNISKDTLKVKFTLKFLSHVFKPSACNDIERYNKMLDMGRNYIEKYGFEKLAVRYAYNIANGRFLWRNRVGAKNVEVIVTTEFEEQKYEWTFDAFDYSLKEFSQDKKIKELADIIAQVFCSTEPKHLLLNIEANAQVGLGQDVYPSEEFIPNKNKNTKPNNEGKKSKVLYQVNGIAALHSQKINNAIRTIDTWYPKYEDVLEPIAIEPYGAVTILGEAFRADNKSSFYGLFPKYSIGEDLNNENEEHYVMAVLIRGGVFGASKKE